MHRASDHRWFCSACRNHNKVDDFPVCAYCGNSFSENGGSLTDEYEKRWQTKLFIESVVTDIPVDKWGREVTTIKAKPRISLRNTLTELRPLVPSDNAWIEKRREYLESVDGKEYFSDDEDDQEMEPSVEDIVRATVEAAHKMAREKTEVEAEPTTQLHENSVGAGARILNSTNRPQTYHGTRAVFGNEHSVTIPLFGKGGGADFAEARAFAPRLRASAGQKEGMELHFPSRPSSRAYSSRPSSRTPSEVSNRSQALDSESGLGEIATEMEADELAVVPVKVAVESVSGKQSKQEHILSVSFRAFCNRYYVYRSQEILNHITVSTRK